MADYRTPTIDELLDESGWLRRFLGDALPADAVDDALQETWDRALRRGVPAAPGALRPWLRTVSRRVASAMRLGDGRRRARERVVAAERDEAGAPAADDVVGRLDLQQRITAIVRELPEPYRSTVLLRYYEEVSVRDLATRFATSPENVYARLARARVMIRDRLPDESRACVPLVVLPAAASANGLAAAAAVVVLTVGGGGLWWVASDVTPNVDRVAAASDDPVRTVAFDPTPAAAAPRVAAPLRRDAIADPSAGATPPAEATGAADAAGDAFVVTVVPSPAAGGELTLEQQRPGPWAVPATPSGPTTGGGAPSRPSTPSTGPARGRTQSWAERLDRDGRARFTDARPGEMAFTLRFGPKFVYRTRLRVADLAAGYVWELGDSRLDVEVFDVDGSPAPHAFVWASSDALDVRAATGADGRVTVPHLVAADYRLYVSIERDGEKVVEEVRQVELGAGEDRRCVFGSPDGLPRWRGALRTVTGELVTGVTANDRAKLVLTHATTRALVPVFVGADGRFDVRLAPGEYRVRVSPYNNEEAHLRTASLLVSTREIDSDVVVPGTRVVVRVVNARQPYELSLRRPEDPDCPDHSAWVRDDGTCVFDGVADGAWEVCGEQADEVATFAVPNGTSWVGVDLVLR